MDRIIKKLLGISVLVLLLSGNANAKDLYTDLITKSKTGKGDIIIEVFSERNFAFELEISFMEDCLNELKVLKKINGEKCSKMDSRTESYSKLWDISSEPNFKKEMLKIVKEVDNGKRSKTEKLKIERLMSEGSRLQDIFNKKFRNITFIMENLK
jgi:excinuclease UvrABC helicase subunit UvrB